MTSIRSLLQKIAALTAPITAAALPRRHRDEPRHLFRGPTALLRFAALYDGLPV